MGVYGKYIAICLKSQMQYRVSFFLTTIGQFIAAFSAFISIRFMFNRFHSVDGFTYEEVLVCYGVVLASFTIAELLGSGLQKMAGMLGNGEFDRVLVRPRRVLFQVMFGKIDFCRLGLLMQAVLVFAFAVSGGVVTWTWDKILTITLMLISGSAVFFSLFMINGACVIFTIEGEFMNIFTYGGRQFGRYPFSIYGKGILRLLTYVIPMAWFQYYPLLYLLGRSKNRLLIAAPMVGVLFLIPSCLFFSLALRRYKSTGS